MEDSDEFKCAVKVVIKRQMRDLMEQLRDSGEEVAVLTVNLDDNTCSHFGSPNGEWFMSEQKDITQSFLNFCQSNTTSGSGKKSVVRTASPQKKKSISSLKQNISNEIPEVKVTIPRNLAGDLSEEDVAALVGRIVATHLAVQEKGDGSSSGTQFDILVRTANHSRSKYGSMDSVPATPTRSSRKRKPTAKFMEGMSSLKKSRKSGEEEDTGSEMEVGNEETSVISLLSELHHTVLKRVKVSISGDKSVNLERYNVDSSETTEALAVIVINELDTVSGGHLANKKSIKVTVYVDDHVEQIEITERSQKCIVCSKYFTVDSLKDHMLTAHKLILPNEATNSAAVDDVNIKTESEVDEKQGYSDFGSQNDVLLKGGDCNLDDDQNGPKIAKRRPCKYGVPKRHGQPSYEPKTCPFCSKIITGNSNLRYHIRRVHMDDRGHKCSICLKGFLTNGILESHMMSMHSKPCQECGQIVNESVPWQKGIDTKSPRVVVCKCGTNVVIRRIFTNVRKQDKKEVYKPNPKPKLPIQYACEYCGKLFSRKKNVIRHSKLHTDTVHDCDHCDETFKTKVNLKKHLAEVHELLPYSCKVCSESFKSSADLTIHMKAHGVEDIKYACEYCGKLFASKKNVKRHTKLHTDFHDCDHCYDSFKSEINLKKHLADVHGLLSYSCEVCSDSFKSSADLTVHMQIHEALGETTSSTVHVEPVHEEQLPTIIVPSDTLTSTFESVAEAVSTLVNDTETYTIQIVEGPLNDLQ